jgi:hypothetical protein
MENTKYLTKQIINGFYDFICCFKYIPTIVKTAKLRQLFIEIYFINIILLFTSKQLIINVIPHLLELINIEVSGIYYFILYIGFFYPFLVLDYLINYDYYTKISKYYKRVKNNSSNSQPIAERIYYSICLLVLNIIANIMSYIPLVGGLLYLFINSISLYLYLHNYINFVYNESIKNIFMFIEKNIAYILGKGLIIGILTNHIDIYGGFTLIFLINPILLVSDINEYENQQQSEIYEILRKKNEIDISTNTENNNNGFAIPVMKYMTNIIDHFIEHIKKIITDAFYDTKKKPS